MSVCHVMINCTLKIIIFPAEKPQFTQHILVRQCPLTFHGKCMVSCITIGSATQSMPYPSLVGSGSTHYVQICTSYDLSRSFVRIKSFISRAEQNCCSATCTLLKRHSQLCCINFLQPLLLWDFYLSVEVVIVTFVSNYSS